MSGRTCPTLLSPAAHAPPSESMRIVMFLPRTAKTNLAAGSGFPKVAGEMCLGFFSEMKVSVVEEGPRAEEALRPKRKACPLTADAQRNSSSVSKNAQEVEKKSKSSSKGHRDATNRRCRRRDQRPRTSEWR